MGVDRFVEVGAGGVLTGLCRQIVPTFVARSLASRATWKRWCMYSRKVWWLCAGLLLTACSPQTKPIDIEKLLQDFIGASLAMSPVTANSGGIPQLRRV